MARPRGLEVALRVGAVLAMVAVALLLSAVAPRDARADEALLPDEAAGDVDADAETDVDPTDTGVVAVGAEPRGSALAGALDSYLVDAFPTSGLPGLAVAVVDADGVRYLRTYGDVGGSDAADGAGEKGGSDATFLIGSLSKSLCAVAVMQLVEEGRVDLDAPAALYASEYATPPEVTVRSLLNQTSGFGYFDALADAQVGESAGEFSYSNANYDLLGRIVGDVSGEDYGTYLREHVFDALGMDDASVAGEPPRAAEAPGHRGWFGVPVADGFEHEEGDSAWGGPASGYVRASISDMASYLRMYLNSGEEALSAASVHQMVFSRVPDPDGDTFYGFGWTTYRWDDGELVMSHDGQVENYVSRMCVIPGRELGVVVLANANDEFGGNASFFQLADDVTSLAVGGVATGVDAGARVTSHVVYDAVYLLAVGVAAVPLVGVLRGGWRRHWMAGAERRWELVLPAAFLHVAVPAYLLGLPGGLGMRWQDFADFYPDQTLVLLACVALLLVGGIGKVVVAVRGCSS